MHYFVEWNVQTTLESDMAHSFVVGTNTDMTATDTQKNTVGKPPCVGLCALIYLGLIVLHLVQLLHRATVTFWLAVHVGRAS